MTTTDPSNIDKVAIDRELALIFASEYFVNAERMREFLEYVVAETLDGRADRIKSYTIAIEVFKRNADFDASLDPIVRTSANRLRAALERYNQNAVNTTGVKITLPKGRYVPVFTQLATSIGDAPNETVGSVSIVTEERFFKKPSWSLAWAIGICSVFVVALATFYYFFFQPKSIRQQAPPVLIVSGVTADPSQPDASKTALGLSRLLVSKLSAYGNSRVVDNRNGNVKLEDFLVHESDVYTLKATVREMNRSISIVWQLDDAGSKEVAWASEEALHKDFRIDGAADLLAGRILGLEGALPILMASLYNGTDDQLGCLTKLQRLRLFRRSALQEDEKNCLEQVVSVQPANAEAWALLAQVYYRLGTLASSLGEDTREYDAKLRDSASKANYFSPNSLMTKRAQLFYAFNSHNLKSFENISRDIIEKYDDRHLEIRIGQRFIYIGLLEEGSNLVNSAIKDNGIEFGLAYLPLAFKQYFLKDYLGALSTLKKVEGTGYYLVPLVKTASLAQLGRQEEAKAALAELHALRPHYERNLYSDMRYNNVSERFIDSLASGLALVGLDVYKPE